MLEFSHLNLDDGQVESFRLVNNIGEYQSCIFL
jgi:hypothetical protein